MLAAAKSSTCPKNRCSPPAMFTGSSAPVRAWPLTTTFLPRFAELSNAFSKTSLKWDANGKKRIKMLWAAATPNLTIPPAFFSKLVWSSVLVVSVRSLASDGLPMWRNSARALESQASAGDRVTRSVNEAMRQRARSSLALRVMVGDLANSTSPGSNPTEREAMFRIAKGITVGFSMWSSRSA